MKTEAQYIAEKMPMARALARKLMWQWHVLGMDAQDVVQEGLIGYLRAMRKYTESEDHTASLDTYASNRMIGAMMDAIIAPARSAKHIPAHQIDDIELALDVSGEDGRDWVDAIHAKQMLESVCKRFDDLPHKQRQVMELMYVDGMSQVDVARQLGVTEGNVSIHHSNAVTNLRNMLIN